MVNVYHNPNKAGRGPRNCRNLMTGARPDKAKEGHSERDLLVAAARWTYRM